MVVDLATMDDFISSGTIMTFASAHTFTVYQSVLGGVTQ